MEAEVVKEHTLRDLMQVFQRRKEIVCGIVLICCIMMGSFCAVCKRRYQATAEIQIQKENTDAMGLDSLMSAASGASDALEVNLELQTQANILQSDTLALKTIEQLHLQQTDDFRPHWSPLAWILGAISPRGVSDPVGATLENAPLERQRVLKVFSKNLEVKPIAGTRLIDITFESPNPALAAAVVNTLVHSLSEYTFQTRYDATNEASKWLSGQLGDLRKQSEESQAKVVDLERESGVYSLGTVDSQGREQAYSGVLDQLQQATTAMTIAEQNRILKGAIAKAAETGDAEMLSGLAGNLISGGSQTMMSSSLTLIQNLRTQEAQAQASLQEAEAKYGPAYPKIAELKGNIAGLDKSIQDEIGRIRRRAESDFSIAVQTEADSRRVYDQAKKRADLLNNKAIDYMIERQEAEDSRELYEDLLKRLEEAGVLAGLKSSNITIVDPGRQPAKPKVPNVPLYMTGALLGGLFLGSCGAFLVDALDNKIISAHDLESLLGEAPLGVLPEVERPMPEAEFKANVLALKDPQSPYIEAMRALRTALLLSQSDAPPKILLITSSIEGEGKSLCSINLATLFAQSGRKTLIVDTDLRRGMLRRRLGLSPERGLSDLLAGQETVPRVQSAPGLENLHFLIAGTVPPNPTDLLESDSMRFWLNKFREQYDFVIMDSAPLLPVADSVALHTLADATLLLVRSRLTERSQVQRSRAILRRKHRVGIVLNGLSIRDSSYYDYYGYRKYGYHYAENNGNDKN